MHFGSFKFYMFGIYIYINNALLTECNYNSTDSNQLSECCGETVSEGSACPIWKMHQIRVVRLLLPVRLPCAFEYEIRMSVNEWSERTNEQTKKKLLLFITNIESLSIYAIRLSHVLHRRLTRLLLLAWVLNIWSCICLANKQKCKTFPLAEQIISSSRLNDSWYRRVVGCRFALFRAA